MYTHVDEAQSPFYKDKRSVHRKIQSVLSKGGEILYEKLPAESETEAFKKEKELIVKYGRKDLKTGILCNLTEGGEGTSCVSPESVRRRAEKHRGMKRSDEARKNMREAQIRSSQRRLEETGHKRSPEAIAKQVAKSKGKPWSEKARKAVRHSPRARPILCYKQDTGEFVGRWESIKECAVALNCSSECIWNIASGQVSLSCSVAFFGGKCVCFHSFRCPPRL